MSDSLPTFVPGQRWVSHAEPELGLGLVLEVEGRRATLVFPANGEVRQYAISHAPLDRVRYAVGDSVTDGADCAFVVESLAETAGLITYHGEGKILPEGRLSDQLVFNRPQDRLLNGTPDPNEAFELRLQTRIRNHDYHASPLRGLLGGRISLIPHQLYVVESVVQRAHPRVLLSDEIGLGKTIEACLILHRKLMLGLVQRALILVPSALVHQWFVELLRRFSLQPAIFDEERCQAIESNPEAGNPFLDDQLVLCGVDWLAASPDRAQQAVEAGWDLLIVDEAHHLEWAPDQPSAAYAVVEALAQSSHGLLLLTATPEEMGGAGHFARLRLLDPDRYASLEDFERESAGYAKLVPLVEAIEEDRKLTRAQAALLAAYGMDASAGHHALVEDLIDTYGPGRVIFRNTRRIIKGFPERKPVLIPIENREEALLDWLVALLDKLAPAKVLAITHTREAAQVLSDALKERTGLSVGVFHEGMSLLQRDRQAAWFADVDGARILVASEIGGEGRNFQFAHHLVLLDVPENPEILEQRIGRLDRIGQTETIHIHVPYRKGTREEFIALWAHEALDAFGTPLPGAHQVYLHFLETLQAPPPIGSAAWTKFIKTARAERKAIADRVVHGRDRLLELHSYRAGEALHWVEAIRRVDKNPTLETFLLQLFEAHNVHPEALEPRAWLLKPDPVFTGYFPGFPKEGMMITFDRETALSREDVGFITWDHPMVHGAMERVLASPTGTASLAVWRGNNSAQFLLDVVFVLETTATESATSRHLPPAPIRILLDEQGAERKNEVPRPGDLKDVLSVNAEDGELFRTRLPGLLREAERIAEQRAHKLRTEAGQRLEEVETAELRRLRNLQKRNDHISDRELEHRAARLATSLDVIRTAPLRLDALRWIWCLTE